VLSLSYKRPLRWEDESVESANVNKMRLRKTVGLHTQQHFKWRWRRVSRMKVAVAREVCDL